MKILAVRTARAVWLFPQYFLNPRGAYIYPAELALKTRYNFRRTPMDNVQVGQTEGLKFENGEFLGTNGIVEIVSVTLHNDGIVVDMRSTTEDCDSFLEDALTWLSNEYGLPSYSDLPIKRIYVSELNVIFEKAPIIINPKLAPFIKELSKEIGSDRIGDLDFMSLYLSPDQTLSNNPPQFRFEREINTPFSENRYYSFSPTTTDIHVKLLTKLEKLA